MGLWLRPIPFGMMEHICGFGCPIAATLAAVTDRRYRRGASADLDHHSQRVNKGARARLGR